MVRPSGTVHRKHEDAGRPIYSMSCELSLVSWPPLRLGRLRRDRGSVVVALPSSLVTLTEEEVRMRRVIGIDTDRTFGKVVIWQSAALRHAGRVDMTRTGLEGSGRSLRSTDEVVIEATGNCFAVARVLSPFVMREADAQIVRTPCPAKGLEAVEPQR